MTTSTGAESTQALQQSYNDLLDASLDAIFLTSLQGIILHANQRAFKLLQAKNKEQLLGHSILDFMLPEEHALANERRQRLCQGLAVESQQAGVFLTCQGQRIKTLRTVVPGLYDNQAVLQTLVRDISEHERIQRSLLRSEERFAKIFRSTPDSITISRMEDGLILEANEGFTRLTGFSTAEAIGKSTLELGLWPFPEERHRMLQQLRDGLAIRDYQTHLRHRSGELRNCSFSIERVIFAGEDCSIAIARDITERTQIEKRLHQQLALEKLRSRLSALLIKTPNARISQVIDNALAEAGRFIGVEHTWLIELDLQTRLRSITHEWVVPGRKPVKPHFQNISLDAYRWLSERTRAGETTVITDPQQLPPEADDVRAYLQRIDVVTLLAIPLVSDGQPYGVVGLYAAHAPADDGTRWLEQLRSIAQLLANALIRKHNEVELTRHREHLEELVKERTWELAAAQEELLRQERLATMGQLTATVSHELRNPLGTISASFAIIRSLLKEPEPRTQRALERIERNIQRCTMIIEQLLSYARNTPPALQAVKLDDWLRERTEEHALPGNISWQLQLNCEAQVALDKQRLGQALDNIINNAWQAMLEQPESDKILRISSMLHGDKAEIQISDSGPGITIENQHKVFEPLFSTKSFGVGLGLPLVKQIMEQHKGEIMLDSKPGQGTTVILRLPLQTQN